MQILGGPQRLVVIFGGAILFNESLDSIKLISASIMMMGLSLYAYGGHHIRKRAEEASKPAGDDSHKTSPGNLTTKSLEHVMAPGVEDRIAAIV